MEHIIGYFWADESTLCERCGLHRIHKTYTRVGEDEKNAPVPIHYNELIWDDNVRCDDCGERLLDPAPPPHTFEQVWAQRQERRRQRALERSAARHRSPT